MSSGEVNVREIEELGPGDTPPAATAGRTPATTAATTADEPEGTLVDALERFAVQAVALTARALATTDDLPDLTLTQWRALVVVDSAGALRVSRIAADVGMSLPSTSRLVRRLERRGLVSIRRDPTDRRATLVRATAAGSALRATVAARRRDLLVAALGDRLARSDPVIAASIAEMADVLETFDWSE